MADTLERIKDSYKYLDKNGLSKLVSLIRNTRIWKGMETTWRNLPASEKNKYGVSEVVTKGNDGLIFVKDALRLNDLNPVTSNAVKRKLGSWYGEVSADPHPDFASAADFDMRSVRMIRSGNSGLITIMPINGMYGVNINSTKDTYGPSTKYGLVTLTMPAGMKLASFWYNGDFGDVYGYAEHVGASVEPISQTLLRVGLWVYPNDGNGHNTEESVLRMYTWITIPVLFDDDWHA